MLTPEQYQEVVSIVEAILEILGHALLSESRLERWIEKQTAHDGKPLFILEMGLLRELLPKLESLTENLYSTLESARPEHSRELSDEEIERLICLNRRLAELEKHLQREAACIIQTLVAKANDPSDRMADFEIEANLSYVLRENDPEYEEDRDNILTKRKIRITRPGNFSNNMDWCDFPTGMLPELRNDPHCWLFHDLYDHSHDLADRRLNLHDSARVGEIWVDICIQQQYFLDIDSGEWVNPFERVARAGAEGDIVARPPIYRAENG